MKIPKPIPQRLQRLLDYRVGAYRVPLMGNTEVNQHESRNSSLKLYS
jgi:hypothetical protein